MIITSGLSEGQVVTKIENLPGCSERGIVESLNYSSVGGA